MVYVSVDVETNGRLPGKHSMLQIGAVAFSAQGKVLERFSINLKPLPGSTTDPSTMEFWRKQPREAQLAVTKNPEDPKVAILRFYDWVAKFKKPLLLMAPVLFDGTWLRWYIERYVTDEARLFHNSLDLRSVIFSFTGEYRGDYRALLYAYTGFQAKAEPSHLAVDDALDQGQCFFAILKYADENGLRRIWKP